MIVVALSGLLFQLASVVPVVSEKTVFYDVEGSSARELRRDLDRKRPTDPKGGRYDAYTKWYVRWRYRYASTASACALSEFGTSVEVVFALPRWSGRAPDPALAERWARYDRALTAHERGHAALGLGAAERIQAQAATLGPAPTCPALEESIKEKAEAILAEVRAEETKYDERTRHGATQGAVFP